LIIGHPKTLGIDNQLRGLCAKTLDIVIIFNQIVELKLSFINKHELPR
jgi:hypothetical protein